MSTPTLSTHVHCHQDAKVACWWAKTLDYGFEGVLCGTCSSGFYLGAADDGYGECRKCASGEVLSAIQIFMIIISASIVTSFGTTVNIVSPSTTAAANHA